MVFEKFLKKTCTLGISASMLLSVLPSNINAIDKMDVTVTTGKGKLVTINRENGGKTIVQLLSDKKYSKGLKQKLIDYVAANGLGANEELYFRYVFKDAYGNTTNSNWKKFENGKFDDEDYFKIEEEGTYEIQYAMTTNNNSGNTDGETAGDGANSETKTTPTVTAPTAKTDLVYSGNAQDLVSAGSTTGGTLKYAVVNENASASEDNEYSETVPAAVNAGNYTVYYKVVGDDNYNDVDPQSINVTNL